MLKIYSFTTNNGDWGGIVTEYTIAENELDAKSQCKHSLQRMENGCDGWISEITGDELLDILNMKLKDLYKIDFIIRKR